MGRPLIRWGILVSGLAVLVLSWLLFFNSEKKTIDPSRKASQGSYHRSSRAENDYDERLEVIVKKLRETREAHDRSVPYNLSKAEVDRFLGVRGRTPATLLFALICSEDRMLLEQVRDLPDSPLKFLVLETYSTAAERVGYAKKLSEQDPSNKISLLILADALREDGQPVESASALTASISCKDVISYQSQLLEEFRQAREIFGEDRGCQILELHAGKYPLILSKQVTGLYLDSLDSEEIVKGGQSTIGDLVASIESLYADIGVPGNISRQQAYLEVGNYARYWRNQSGNAAMDQQLKELARNSDAEFMQGMKSELRIQELNEADRRSYWEDLFFNDNR